jgi:hypothetical protein
VFVCDEKLNAVIELDSTATIRGEIAQRGVGPGELSLPTAVAVQEGRLLVADACFRLQVFDSTLRFVNSYPLDWEVVPFEGLGVFGNVVCIPFGPLPAYRSKIVHFYELGDGHMHLIGSLFDYVRPKKRYSDPTGALLTQNRVRLATDGRRYLAVGRPHEAFVSVVDVTARVAWRYVFQGAEIRRRKKRGLGPGWPDFAAIPLYGALSFDPPGKLWVQFEFGILRLEPGADLQCVLFVPESACTAGEAVLPGALSGDCALPHISRLGRRGTP